MIARPHPERAFALPGRPRSDANLSRRARGRGLPAQRLDQGRSIASIRSILENGLDRAFLDEDERSDREPVRHANIRGRGYFH